tara:strand:- start:312 stop:668 length:357 start_codon:yes stop_codon:yes gene_type:complete
MVWVKSNIISWFRAFALASMEARMKIQAVRCFNCNTIVFSRCKKDVMACNCFNLDRAKRGPWIAIRGGPEDPRVSGQSKALFERVEIEIDNISAGDLYRDWNYDRNKFGMIEEESDND